MEAVTTPTTDTELVSERVSALQRALSCEVITYKEAFDHLLHIVAGLHRRLTAVEASEDNGDSTTA